MQVLSDWMGHPDWGKEHRVNGCERRMHDITLIVLGLCQQQKVVSIYVGSLFVRVGRKGTHVVVSVDTGSGGGVEATASNR